MSTDTQTDGLPTIPLLQLIPTLPRDYDYDAGLECALDCGNYTAIAQAMHCSRRTLIRLRHEYVQLDLALTRARALSLDYIADELRTLVEDHPEFHQEPQLLKTMFETRRWYLACSDPRKYGDRMNIEVTEHVDLKGSLEQARTRVLKQITQASAQADTVQPLHNPASDHEVNDNK